MGGREISQGEVFEDVRRLEQGRERGGHRPTFRALRASKNTESCEFSLGRVNRVSSRAWKVLALSRGMKGIFEKKEGKPKECTGGSPRGHHKSAKGFSSPVRLCKALVGRVGI